MPDPAAVAATAARYWSDEAREAVQERGAFRVALSGGKTPAALFGLLAGERFRSLPWERTEVYWADERHVPPHYAESNYRLAKELLLDRVPVPAANIHPMPTGSADPAEDALAYELALRRVFPGRERPAFDLVLLGLGEDGHTASLFPGDPALQETARWVAAARSPKGVAERITLTAPAINGARAKVFLVCGAEKAGILDAVRRAPAVPPLPAQLIEEPVFIADRDATPWLEG